ncbi:inner membrane transport permease YbhS [Clostridium homopropionicum DSM 5847]|uniref:Inner membrane transport permease YbhS n=2 Tax=Clostridium TaxID=1485 RepID=A0A0L6ZBQ7_9CLOT|nr:inner membrane transport permease YbhS [Clostridium homopropionicum DSM 5847]SFG75358.1 sodium transport system permease protein [Clostridium homopropionicum]
MSKASLVFKKELRDLFRDRKTLLVSILIPLIIMPLIFFVIGKSASSNEKKVEENFKIAITGGVNSEFVGFVKKIDKVQIIDSKNPEEDVKEGKLLLALEVPDNIDSLIKDEKDAPIKIIYDNSSQQSSMAQSRVENYIQEFSKQIVATRLEARGIKTSILNPVQISYKTTTKQEDSMGKVIIAMILPLFLVIYSVTGPMGPAIDLGAGEKERGTLEPLLTTQAGRMSLLWGKFAAISVIGLITTLASMIGIVIALKQSGNSAMGVNINAGMFSDIGIKGAVLITVMVILMNLTFGALELAISIYARSFKEAQTYLTPLNIIALAPIYLTYMLDARNIDMYYFHIPIANAVCLIKEFLAGVFNTGHILITFGWILFYIVLCITFARYMFSREEVIFRT